MQHLNLLSNPVQQKHVKQAISFLALCVHNSSHSGNTAPFPARCGAWLLNEHLLDWHPESVNE